MRIETAFLCITVLLSACSSSGEYHAPDPDRVLLNEKRAQWRALKLADYDYEFARHCFCGGLMATSVRITVANGAVVEVRIIETGDIVPQADLIKFFDITVEDLFQAVEQAISAEADELTIEYDDSAGYPSRLYVDPTAGVADEEYGFQAEVLMLQ